MSKRRRTTNKHKEEKENNKYKFKYDHDTTSTPTGNRLQQARKMGIRAMTMASSLQQQQECFIFLL